MKLLLFIFQVGTVFCRVKGSQLGAFHPQAVVYCYREFKLRYHKNLKLLLIRIKELFEPIVLLNKKQKTKQNKKKSDGFLLSLKAIS